jgi:4-diphosphocytidyl-2C-methyl-D-erythritol kinase
MSGSGATCFGLFEDKDKAEAAVKALSLSNSKYWVQASALVG